MNGRLAAYYRVRIISTTSQMTEHIEDSRSTKYLRQRPPDVVCTSEDSIKTSINLDNL